MPYEFKATRRVEFSDTDMAGIMHYRISSALWRQPNMGFIARWDFR
jgi:hypothetical protein